jgi:LmbE family N-acetylglucosaminyl deacetylase
MSLHATWPELPGVRVTEALAVVAHPDDESFGLGAILSALSGAGAAVRVLCLTHGEASTLGSTVNLAQVRGCELRAAATVLGVCDVALLDYPDGGLADVPSGALDAEVEERLGEADVLVVFEPGGVTGHPDHQAASPRRQRRWRARR